MYSDCIYITTDAIFEVESGKDSLQCLLWFIVYLSRTASFFSFWAGLGRSAEIQHLHLMSKWSGLVNKTKSQTMR